MRMSDVPTVARAYQYILSDNDGDLAGEVDMGAEVPVKWEERFLVCEVLLRDVADKDVCDIVPKEVQEKDPTAYTKLPGDDPLLYTVLWCIANPLNEQDDEIMAALGWSPEAQDIVKAVMLELFSSELEDDVVIRS